MGNYGHGQFNGFDSEPNDGGSICQVCLKFTPHCICPVCPVCSIQGRPKCYSEHGLVRAPEQRKAATTDAPGETQ